MHVFIKAAKKVSAPKKRGRKSQATAAKVNLMKIKMSATGEKFIPIEERVYLQIKLPTGSTTEFKNLFFSKVLLLYNIILYF